MVHSNKAVPDILSWVFVLRGHRQYKLLVCCQCSPPAWAGRNERAQTFHKRLPSGQQKNMDLTAVVVGQVSKASIYTVTSAVLTATEHKPVEFAREHLVFSSRLTAWFLYYLWHQSCMLCLLCVLYKVNLIIASGKQQLSLLSELASHLPCVCS